jgi:glutamate-1-semialdehyde 2,1-aminomutase
MLATESNVFQRYIQRTPGSARLYAKALELFPGGVTHIGRHLEPHPLYVTRAAGSRKWDVDGNEYTDYFGGHGALLLGHNHPQVMEAVVEQLARGVHYGASHEKEIEWAEMIRSLIPCAEKVRFTVTGTEATMLAMRLARAFTGKSKIVRFAGHFHGWHDHVAFPEGGAPGILPEVAEGMLICPPNDSGHLTAALESRSDIAAVIIEPTGATFGQIPTRPGFLNELRALTRKHDVLLIFDEVITGFRCSPGGAQGYYQVTPDLATLAKLVAGGLPGAAVAGRRDVLDQTGHSAGQPPRVAHQGTYNAGPLSAVAGIATLRVVRDTDIIQRANATAAAIRDGMNRILQERESNWCVYGDFSAFHIFPNADGVEATPQKIMAGEVHWSKLKGRTPAATLQRLRTGFLAGGVDIIGWPGGLVSGVHNEEDVERTLAAFAAIT